MINTLNKKDLQLSCPAATEAITMMGSDWKNFIDRNTLVIKELKGLSKEDLQEYVSKMIKVTSTKLPDSPAGEIVNGVLGLNPEPFIKYTRERSQKVWLKDSITTITRSKKEILIAKMVDFTKTITQKGALGTYFEKLTTIDLILAESTFNQLNIESTNRFNPKLKPHQEAALKDVETDPTGVIDKLLTDLKPQYFNYQKQVLEKELDQEYRKIVLSEFRPNNVISCINELQAILSSAK